MEQDIKLFTPEGNEFIGIKAGQDYYKLIAKDLSQGVNKILFPEGAEVSASWVRGFMGFRDDNLYVTIRSENPELDDKLKKWTDELSCIHGDAEIIDNSKKKK